MQNYIKRYSRQIVIKLNFLFYVDPPGPPIDLKAEDITKTTATLTWKPPEFDGGSPIIGYYVERKSGSRWIKVNKKPVKNCKLLVDDLIEKDKYEFRVCAENEAGVGEPCDTISFVAKDPFDVPGQPGKNLWINYLSKQYVSFYYYICIASCDTISKIYSEINNFTLLLFRSTRS